MSKVLVRIYPLHMRSVYLTYLLGAILIGACQASYSPPVDHHYASLETEALLASWQQTLTTRPLSDDEQARLNLHVRAIFAHRCFGCHSTSKHKGALILDTKAGVFDGGDNGAILVAGRPDKSEVMRRVRLPSHHEDAMPPEDGPLSSAEIETLALWIDQGAPWTDQQLKIFREAPLALTRPSPDSLESTFTHPIDRWVDDYFQARQMNWPALIDDHRYVRKVYLDLIGLLPSADDISDFVTDQSPSKRIELVDRLLADRENFAVHWMTFWNDLLRNDYSGTGFITNGRSQISGWLYHALLDNLPYDSLVLQLLNPTADSEGFIKGIRWRGEVNASQTTELQAAQNISQSLLGLNLKCASCHNSFINNVTLQQAYDFAQIFADSTLQLYRCDKPTGKFASPNFVFPELGVVSGGDVSERLASLAQVMVQPANGRLYRTIVNRYWHQFFGRGLIAPLDEMDNRPWSQDLLDWLTTEFVDQGYDLNALIRTIVTSRSYQMVPADNTDPNYVKSPKFQFRGPIPRKMTAEQMADALSAICVPVYHALAYDPDNKDMSAHWIWHRQLEFDRTVLPYPGKRFFRYKFGVRKGVSPTHAEVLITADHKYDLYLNTTRVGSGTDWHQVDRYQVTDLLSLDNVIAIEAENEGQIPNPAGILFALRIDYEDGVVDTIFSSTSWLTNDRLQPEGWTALEYQDEDWEKAWKAGSFSGGSWGRLLSFTFETMEEQPLARAALVRLDPFMKGLGRPARDNVTTKRDDEPTLLQALLLSNDLFLSQAIHDGAQRWLLEHPDEHTNLVDDLFQQALGRQPTETEKARLLEEIGTKPSTEQIADIIWSILLLPEFQFI